MDSSSSSHYCYYYSLYRGQFFFAMIQFDQQADFGRQQWTSASQTLGRPPVRETVGMGIGGNLSGRSESMQEANVLRNA